MFYKGLRQKMWLIFFITCGLLIGIDQLTKYIALINLKPIGNIEVVKGFLDFTFVENRGAAFGILTGRRWFFVILTIVVSIVIIYAFFKMPKNKEYNMVRICLGFILSGAVGNMIDRILYGYVIDFLEFTFISYPVFNIADIYVVGGTIFLAILLIFVIKEEPKGGLEEETESMAETDDNRNLEKQ